MPNPAQTAARVVPFPARPKPQRKIEFSIVIEWENARVSELGRTHRMLEVLAGQIAALDARRFALRQVVFLFERHGVQRSVIEQAVARHLMAVIKPEQLRLIDTEGLDYYQLKNFGARHCEGDVVVLLDSDVIPEARWLVRLLVVFRHPQAAVVAGTSYIELENLYSKAVALWWLFQLRTEGRGLVRVKRFWANNVAFRRNLFLETGFPDSTNFRGQCNLLAKRLRRQGVPIVRRLDARISHPAPNGWKHFICRGMCQGHDNTRLLELAKYPEKATWGASLRRFALMVGNARLRIREHRASVGVGALGGVCALLLAIFYFGLMFIGERIALRRPAFVRKYFPI